MVKTVCGNETNEPITLNYNGERYFFCAETCKDKFLAAPDKSKWLEGHQQLPSLINNPTRYVMRSTNGVRNHLRMHAELSEFKAG